MALKRLFKRLLSLMGVEERHLAFPLFRKNSYSQNGEDGILEFILNKLPTLPRYIVDIGANDGVTGSNSRLLIEHGGFSGLLIEPYVPIFEKLRELYADHPMVIVSDKAVGPQARERGSITWHDHIENVSMPIENVNTLLRTHAVPCDIGVLSIDIDGGDNDVLRAIDWNCYKPWIVIAEIDSSQAKNLQEQIELMDQAGYCPFLHIGNVFYARKDLAGELFFNWRIPLKGRFGFFLKNR